MSNRKKAELEKFDLEKYAEREKIEVNPIKERREKTAGIMATLISFAFLFLVLTPIWLPERTAYVKDILLPVSTLIGTAFGFYFSEKRLQS